MIPFDKALEITLNSLNSYQPAVETVALTEASGRVLAEDIVCDRDIPPFDRVAMDGYACKKEDIGNCLDIIEFVPAGKHPEKVINSGQCSKVMTGCMLPEGADLVFQVELAQELSENTVRCIESLDKVNFLNYCPAGEDNKKGDTVIPVGTLLHPGHMGVLGSLGYERPKVFKKPVIGIIATGDELVEPSETPKKHQIRNANSYILYSQILKAGGVPKYFGIVRDNPENIDMVFKSACACCDVILLTGGVSMGDYDFVPQILNQNSFNILYDRVAVKPGKPTTFSTNGKKFTFGMPGNPVSTFMIFEVMVKPFVQKMQGVIENGIKIMLPLKSDIKRKKASRRQWIPVSVSEEGIVNPLTYHGSGHFNSLSQASGIISIPEGVIEIKKGTLVHVRHI